MKKIKLFALAVMAMLGTNAMAADIVWVSGQKTTVDNIQYTVTKFYKSPADANERNEVSVKANNFTGTALTIPGTIELDIEVTGDSKATTNAYTGKATFIVTEIENNGFKDNLTLESVSLPANLETIGTSAFEGCENLATVTLAASSKLNTIGIGAFAWTSITTLDLTSATEYNPTPATASAKTGMTAFGTADATYGPFTCATTGRTVNAMIEEVKLPSTCVTLQKNAMSNCTALETVDLKTVKTISESAFSGDIALTEAVIGTAPAKAFAAAEGISVGATAFNGCTALATVELGKLIAASITADAFTGCTGLTTLKYNEIAAAQTTKPFVGLTSIEEIYFQKYITVASAIPTGSFNVQAAGSALESIYYNAVTLPASGTYVQPFATDAFSTAATPRNADLYCLDAFYTAASGFNSVATVLDGVTIAASADEVIGNADKKLLKDKNSSSYYYYYKPTALKAIARNQESGAKVTVYQAYIDVVGTNEEANLYMIPLMVSNDQYVVDANETVIIKSNQEDGVVASPAGTASTMLMNSGSIVNDLELAAAKVSALTVKTGATYLNSGANDLYFLNNPATSGFGFTKYDTALQTGGLAAGAVYMTCAHTAAARLNVIWLDQNSDATAIIGAKTAAENVDAAIYNLAGQKVDANFKGIVVKNGKKMIQK